MLASEPVLIVCPEESTQGQVAESIRSCGLHSLSCSNSGEARTLLERQRFEVVVCSESLAERDLRDVIKSAKPAPVIIVCDHAEWSRYLAALRAGAFDCIAFTPRGPQIKRALWSAMFEHATVERKVMSTL